ncbi:MAG: polysaccharide biosynthesis C-terminal domain-containing protein, partial [Candidatus Omnitrophota bacterium]
GIFVPIIAGILLFADKFTLLVYGNDFAGSAAILRILTLYVACFSFSIYFSSLLDYQGLARKRAVALSFSTALNIALNFVLIPRYGAAGAAIATTVSYLPYLALNGLEARRVLAG